jgi:hypothetical protein
MSARGKEKNVLLACNSNPLPVIRNREISHRQSASHKQPFHLARLELVAPNCPVFRARDKGFILVYISMDVIAGSIVNLYTVAAIP